MINTQFWAATFFNEYEAWSNYRRTGYPVLVPVNYPGSQSPNAIPRRMQYSTVDKQVNSANYNAAVAGLSGGDKITSRMWWDTPQLYPRDRYIPLSRHLPGTTPRKLNNLQGVFILRLFPCTSLPFQFVYLQATEGIGMPDYKFDKTAFRMQTFKETDKLFFQQENE